MSPLPNDRANFTALVHSVRVALDALTTTTGKPYELTCYAPASAANIAHWDLAALKHDFDFFNVQGYDLHGPWDSITGHQSGLAGHPSKPDGLDITSVLALYTAAGVPPAQLLVGAPFYGYSWSGVGPTQNGFDQSGAGGFASTYAQLSAPQGWAHQFMRVWDSYAQVPSLYEISPSGVGRWVSYDDPQSLAAKARYSQARGYGGVFFWQLGGDSADRSLLVTLSDSLAQVPTADTDADGVPDAWEQAYFSSLATVTATSDADGDGRTDRAEFLSRTHPQDSRDKLELEPGGSPGHLCFRSAAGVDYRLQRSTDLAAWTTVSTSTGTGGLLMLHDSTAPPGNPSRVFYRLALPE